MTSMKANVPTTLVILLMMMTVATAAPTTSPAPQVVSLALRGDISPSKPLLYTHPDGPKGWHAMGFRREHDGTADWRVPVSEVLEVARRLQAAGREYGMVVYSGDDHPLSKNFDDVIRQSLKWFGAHRAKPSREAP